MPINAKKKKDEGFICSFVDCLLSYTATSVQLCRHNLTEESHVSRNFTL